jgi:hypothetical protein
MIVLITLAITEFDNSSQNLKSIDLIYIYLRRLSSSPSTDKIYFPCNEQQWERRC